MKLANPNYISHQELLKIYLIKKMINIPREKEEIDQQDLEIALTIFLSNKIKS